MKRGEHCGHHQNTATPPRRPRPPGRVPPRLQLWLDNARPARGRLLARLGVGGVRALPLPPLVTPGKRMLSRRVKQRVMLKSELRRICSPHNTRSRFCKVLRLSVVCLRPFVATSACQGVLRQSVKRDCKKLSACKREDGGSNHRKNISCCTHKRQR